MTDNGMIKVQYRCTRNELYTTPNCPGHRELSARQGYYLRAFNVHDALTQMRAKFPNDNPQSFTAMRWLH